MPYSDDVLKIEEQNIYSVFNATPSALVMINQEGKIELANQTLCELFGYSGDELIGQGIEILIPEKFRQNHHQYREGYNKKPEKRTMAERADLHARAKDGREFPVEIGLNPVKVNQAPKVIASVTDITERRKQLVELKNYADQLQKTNEDLKIEEQNIYSVFNATPSALVMINQEGKIELANQTLCELFGYSGDELIGQGIEILIPEKFRQNHHQYREGYNKKPEKRTMAERADLHARAKDGREFPVEIGLNPVKVNQAPKVIASVTDITERRKQLVELKNYADQLQKTNEDLKIEEQNIYSVFNATPSALVMINQEGKIELANQTLCELFGYSGDELIGQGIEILIPEKFRQNHHQYREGYNKKPEKRTMAERADLHARAKDGREFPVEIGLNPVKVNQAPKVIASVTDITERRKQLVELKNYADQLQKTNEDLKIEEQNIHSVFNATPSALVMINQEGKIELANQTLCELFGYSGDELIGQGIEILIPEKFRQNHHQYREGYNKKPEKRTMAERADLHARAKDGREFPVEIGLNPVKVNQAPKVIAAVTDITERRKQLATLQNYTSQLKKSNENLEQFAYVASHDLQEPLRMVSSYTQLLAARYKDKLDDDADEFIQYAVDGAKRMQVLIQDLLRFSRLTAETIKKEHVDTNVLYDYAVNNLKLAISDTSTLVTKDELPMIWGDKGQLGQLFQNLIGNAIKYRDPKKNNQIHVSAEHIGNMWQFCVRDNGIGIQSEYFERIFVIFQRLHGVHEYTGTGIGLALCKRIIDTHGGEIWIESEYGQGSRFYFSLYA